MSQNYWFPQGKYHVDQFASRAVDFGEGSALLAQLAVIIRAPGPVYELHVKVKIDVSVHTTQHPRCSLLDVHATQQPPKEYKVTDFSRSFYFFGCVVSFFEEICVDYRGWLVRRIYCVSSAPPASLNFMRPSLQRSCLDNGDGKCKDLFLLDFCKEEGSTPETWTLKLGLKR